MEDDESKREKYLEYLQTPEGGGDIYQAIPYIIKIARKQKPKIIFDLGVRKGHTSITLSIIAYETNGHVWGVDILDCPRASNEIDRLKLTEKWTFVKSDSVKFMKEWNKEKADLIMIDTSHTYEQTLKELEASKEVLKEDGIILLHDTIAARATIQVLDAIQDFRKKYPDKWTFKNYKYGLGVLRKKKKNGKAFK